MKKFSKNKQSEIINNILLYMKTYMEENGYTKDNFWINIEFEKEYYLMGVDEPQIQPDSEDVQAIKNLIECTNEQIDSAIKVCLSKELLTKRGAFGDGYCITSEGLNIAENYVIQLKYLKINPIIRFFKEMSYMLQSRAGIITTILTFAIGLILNALINLDKIIQNWQQFIEPLLKN